MLDTDKPHLARLLTGISEVYDKPVSEAAMGIWWNLLKPFPLTNVERAFNAHTADPDTGKWFPRPADIIGRITGGSEAMASEAWSKVLRAIRTVSTYASVAFDDPLIHATIETMGGWKRFGLMLESEVHWRRQEFIRAYAAYRQQGKRDNYPAILHGKHHAPGGKVVLIGDKQRAAAVMAGGFHRLPGSEGQLTAVSMTAAGIKQLESKP